MFPIVASDCNPIMADDPYECPDGRKVTKEEFLHSMMYYSMVEENPTEYLDAASLQRPEWHQAHMAALQKVQASKASKRRSPEPQRMEAPKVERKDSDGKAESQERGDEKAMEAEDDSQMMIAKIMDTVNKIGFTQKANTGTLEKAESDAILQTCLIKKRDLSMKNFFSYVEKIVEKNKRKSDLDEIISRVWAAGPVITIEAKFFTDVRKVKTNMMSIVDDIAGKDIVVVAGKGPLKQVLDKAPEVTQKLVREIVNPDGKSGKGKGKGHNVTTWWPKSLREPGWSIHIDGRCVINCAVSPAELEQSVAVADKIGEYDGEELVEELRSRLSAEQILYEYEVVSESKWLSKPLGKQPKKQW